MLMIDLDMGALKQCLVNGGMFLAFMLTLRNPPEMVE
jgi:hypothetical protein